jgi:glycosyltransferase involved in cell wall biosynthesis
MKILTICNNLDIGNHGGGAEAFAAELSMSLKQLGDDVVVALLTRYHSNAEEEWIEKLAKDGVSVEFLNSTSSKNIFRSLFNAYKLCKSQSIELVHSHSQVGSIIACAIKIMHTSKFIVRTAHVSVEWGEGFVRAIFRSIFNKLTFPILFDAQVSVNQAMTEKMQRYPGFLLGKKKLITIHTGLSQEKISLAEKTRTPYDERRMNKPILISIGRLSKEKGFSDLISVLPEIIKYNPATELWLVGAGDQLDNLKEMIKRVGVEDHVIFWGQQKNVFQFLCQSTIFILPSRREGFPLAVIESMFCGLPIISYDISGISNLIIDGYNGWLVEPKNEQLLLKTIKEKLNDKNELLRISKNNLESCSKFTMLFAARKYRDLYLSL